MNKSIKPEFTKQECIEILTECKLVSWAVAALEHRAKEALRLHDEQQPDLRVVNGKKPGGKKIH